MPVLTLHSGLHKRGAAAVLLLLAVAATAAVTVSAQTMNDFPPVDCDSTVPNCLECRKVGLLTVCSQCEQRYSTVVTPTNPNEFGKCRLYNPRTCALPNCVRCAADDNTKCVQCPTGYPSMSTYMCEENTAPPANVTTAPPANNCQVPSCVTCAAGNMYTCSVCKPGMVLVASGQCMDSDSCSVANCAQCYPTDNNRCSSCNFGYALTASHACTPRRTGNAAAAPMSVVMALAIISATMPAVYTA